MDYLKTYGKATILISFNERLEYLKLGDNNVTSPRGYSQEFYKSEEWLKLREAIILRDFGCDLGIPGLYIEGPILVHHINPIDKYDIFNKTKKLLDPENLICTSRKTHNFIHYSKKIEPYVERRKGDTVPWGKLLTIDPKYLTQ